MPISRIVLKPGRHDSLLRRHPWVFSGAVHRIDGNPASGETVDVLSKDGQWLARAAWSAQSQIVARVWTFNQGEDVDAAFFTRRIAAAVTGRQIGSPRSGRLVYAESDGLPGLIVDRYGDFLVVQFLAAGPELWRKTIVAELMSTTGCAGVWERSDVAVRELEGLELRSCCAAGIEPPPLIEIAEGSLRYLVDVRQGHKTGFYLDQYVNRALVSSVSADAEVLNCFAYTGGFGIAAAVGGAVQVTNIDSSGPALELARQNASLNGIGQSAFVLEDADVFKRLREYRDSRRSFDIIVLDPPKFAESRGQVDRAARGYKDLNLLALKLLRPAGRLFTFSCSGHIKTDLFQKIVADAAVDAGRDAQILARLEQAPDHPTLLAFPEATYLKGLSLRVA